MNTMRGRLTHFSLMALWAVIVWLVRAYLPDAEAGFLLWAVGYLVTHFIVDAIWPDEEVMPTVGEFCMYAAYYLLFFVWLMWLPDGGMLMRIKQYLPLDLTGNIWVATGLLIGFAAWAILAHRIFTGFERKYFGAGGAVYAGFVALDAFAPRQVNDFAYVAGGAFILALCGFWGPEFPQWFWGLLTRRREQSTVFGRAAFAEDLKEAERAGLKRPGERQ